MRLACIATSLILLLPTATWAQTRWLPSSQDARKAAEGITAAFAAGNFSGAMKEMSPLSVIPAPEFAAFEAQLNSQLDNILRRMGNPTSYEFLREEQAGSRLIRFRFLVFHEKAPIQWNYIFYKSEKGWIMTHFNFSGSAPTFFAGGN